MIQMKTEEMSKCRQFFDAGNCRHDYNYSTIYFYGTSSWEDWNEIVEPDPTVCLFCELVAISPKEASLHMKQKHNFDLHGVQRQMGNKQACAVVCFFFTCIKIT